jgi:Protein of unknown function (DUF973)/zinc-ribbon domain
MPFCPKCGTNVDPGAQFCPSCGFQMASSSPPMGPQMPSSPGGMSPPFGAPQSYSAADRTALGKIKTFALIGIIGIILGLVVPLFTLPSAMSLSSASSLANNVATIASGLVLDAIVSVVGFILGIIAIFMVRSAFKTLSTVDARFSTPAKLVLGIFAGLILLVIAFGILIASLASTASSGVVNAAGIVGSIGIIALAGIASLIGLIGIILGLWRAGERYNEGLMKIGGILFIIPLLDVAAPFLVYFGASGASKKVPQS